MPPERVVVTAKETGAVPYDIPGVKFTHVGEKCSFDAFISEYKLDAPGLDRLADIVRGADTSRLDLTPQWPACSPSRSASATFISTITRC